MLVSSAGAMPTGPLSDLAVDDWEQMVDVNVKGLLFGIAAALPVFQAQESGHFVNIASTAARKTAPNQAVYSATKAAVLALSDGLRQELAGKLRVTVISPGFTDTNFLGHVRDDALRSQMKEAAAKFACNRKQLPEQSLTQSNNLTILTSARSWSAQRLSLSGALERSQPHRPARRVKCYAANRTPLAHVIQMERLA